jgi:DNA-directed RNA polymerase specialized sigma24 family protein
MTLDQFEAIAVLISSREPTRSATRRVLVDGITPADAAREFDLKPQSVSNTLRRFRSAEETILTAYTRQ